MFALLCTFTMSKGSHETDSLLNALVAGVLAALASLANGAAVLVVAVVVTVGPVGLPLKGRTSSLAWTSRLRATALVTAAIVTALVVGAALTAFPVAYAVILLGFPWLVDLALLIWNPIQRRADQRWVDQAKAGLDRSGARVVAITGSYGKTTTKGYLAHLLAGQTTVLASPASFNNRMGLARAVNEHLGPGTDVFIAEMGIYGPGEIRDMCTWIPPEVGVFTALGPVHLERMKTLENIARAKREIFERAPVGVILVDDPIMAEIAAEESERRRMITVSVTGEPADVAGDRRGLSAPPGDRGGDFVHRFLAAAGDNHVGAAGGQQPGGRLADAAARAGDEGDLAVEVLGNGRIGHWSLLAVRSTHRRGPRPRRDAT